MGTSLNKKSVDPAVDYEQFTEDVGRAAHLKLRAHEQREKGYKEDKPKINKERKKDRVKVSEHRAKDKGAPNTSLLAGRAFIEDENKAKDDAETALCVEGRVTSLPIVISATRLPPLKRWMTAILLTPSREDKGH
ncbi:hypothetical protein E4U61_006559 [Claviceps capensis]|nr:hypothetical protein E4U61_006559 [Claviceps capensis]